MKKMKSNLLILLFLCISYITCYGQTEYCSKYDNETILRKTHLTISYNNTNKIPNYVGYILTKDMTIGSAKRESNFYTETKLLKKYRSYTSNYTNSGYDRGHMSPAADWDYSQEAMHETFCMSNICPQNPNLNRFYWVQIETEERYLSHLCDTLYVITGSICYPNTNKIYIKNKVRVPDAFYKACVGIYNHNVVITVGWIYKNISKKQTMSNCECTIDYIESIIDKDLFNGLWFNNLYENKNKTND